MLGHFTAVLSARPVDDNGIDEPSNGCNIPLSDCKGNKLPINYGWMEKGEAQLVGTRHPHRCFAVLTCSILSSSVRFYRTLPYPSLSLDSPEYEAAVYLFHPVLICSILSYHILPYPFLPYPTPPCH